MIERARSERYSTPMNHIQSEFNRIELFGQPFDVVTESQTCEHIMESLRLEQGGVLITANLDYLRRCVIDKVFSHFVANSELVVADGMPLIWASRLQGTPLPERVAGSTLCVRLAGELAREKRSLFLLGGNPGVADEAGQILQARFPGLVIGGTYCPEFGFEGNPESLQSIRDQIRSANPDVVYVALGSPKQERLSELLRPDLPRAWWIGIGISLSFITGEVQRAPAWVQKSGFEWVHRLVQEPQRLGKRYLVQGLPFAARLLANSVWNRVRRS